MQTVKHTDIVETFFGCPYCGTARPANYYRGCCGESSAHFCTMYVLPGDIVMTEHEVRVSTMSHYFKPVGDQFQLYISYDGEHFHFIAQRPSLAVLTAMASEIYRDNA